jgi:ADP-heptose:LPS heptosyltransferase
LKKKSYFAAIQNLFNFLIFLILDLFIKIKKVKTNPNTLLLIKLDSIGDYILFRNLISVLKENRFRNYKITFCGNIAVKDLAVSYDKDLFDDFIWIDRQAFLTSISYKFRILKDLYSRGFDTAINSTYTREILFGDQIIKSVNARVRIGSSGSPDKTDKTRVFSDRFYTELIPQENSNLFEFQRNKEFIEKLINKETEIISTSITPLPDNYDPGFRNYILLFPGSKEESRNWNTDNFAAIGNYILNNSNYNLVIEGSSKDGQKAKEIIKNIRFKERVTDFTG